MSAWQPIDTAPRDGTDIILGYAGSHSEEGRWMGDPSRNHWRETGWFASTDDVLCDHPKRPTGSRCRRRRRTERMADTTGIAWTDATFNPWWGCTKVSPACDFCYAERDSKRYGFDLWGPGKQRRFFGDKHWNEPRRWSAKGPRKVFCASMADVFDNEVAQEHRERLWALIRETPNLTWQVLTKRIGNAPKMLPADWGSGYPNVWLVITVINPAEIARDVPKLREVPARTKGLSVEPQLEAVDAPAGIDWIITGGESGHRARPYRVEWARRLIDQGRSTGQAIFVKQLGANPDIGKLKHRAGADPAEWPEDIRVRQFPAAPPEGA